MKLIQISFRFEFSDVIERILDRHEIRDFVRWPMIDGRDCDGKAYGTKVYPGSVTVVNAQVQDEKVDDLMDDLESFRRERKAHRHLQALVLNIEHRLEDECEDEDETK